jgi:hypothetical protein
MGLEEFAAQAYHNSLTLFRPILPLKIAPKKLP